MSRRPRIYLDNAATSWPKPESVYAAVDRCQRELGAAAGRGGYAEAVAIDEGILAARKAVASLIGAEHPSRVVFTANGTDSLNLALHGLLRPGDHVVTTVAEHNSVLRPLRFLEGHRQINVTRVRSDKSGWVNPDDVQAAMRSKTRLVVVTHASNVTGAIQPIAQLTEIAKRNEALFLLDAAQTLGHLEVRVDQLPVDLLAAPGHKGLLGPLGTGVLYIRPGVESHLLCTRQGGTGTRSEEDSQPQSLPDKYESGNHNCPALFGLRQGIEFVEKRDLSALRQHEMELTEHLLAGLADIQEVTVHGPRDASRQVGVISVTLKGYDPQELAATLDAGYRIQVRSGFHCAPLMHQALGTAAAGGTVRFSVGALNTIEQITDTLTAVREIATAALPH